MRYWQNKGFLLIHPKNCWSTLKPTFWRSEINCYESSVALSLVCNWYKNIKMIYSVLITVIDAKISKWKYSLLITVIGIITPKWKYNLLIGTMNTKAYKNVELWKYKKGNKKYNIFITELAQLYQDTNEASLSLLLLENIWIQIQCFHHCY